MLATKGKLAAHGGAVALIVAGAGGDVLDVAFAVVVDDGETGRGIVAQRQVADRRHAVGVIVAQFPGDQ